MNSRPRVGNEAIYWGLFAAAVITAAVVALASVRRSSADSRTPLPSETDSRRPPSARADRPEPRRAAPAPDEPMQAEVWAPNAAALESVWGIEAVGLRRSVGGRMLDFRYKVVDPVKAAIMAYQEDVSYLVDSSTGARLDLLPTAKLGALRESLSDPLLGREYSIVFPNPQGRFKPGSQVTLVIGDFRAENLTVQ